jgi:hypothetical protein
MTAGIFHRLKNSQNNSSPRVTTKFNMKIKLFKSNCLATALAALGAQLIGAPVSSAANLYPVTVNAVGITTNQDGNLSYRPFNNWTLIHSAAAAQGITNLTGISVVYNLQADNIQVVSGTNYTVLDTPLYFDGGVSLSNTNNTKVQRLTNVYWETNQTASGTMIAGESIRYGATNQITGFSLAGQLQFALPGDGSNSPAIYYGQIQTRAGICYSSSSRQGQQGDNQDGNSQGSRRDD